MIIFITVKYGGMAILFCLSENCLSITSYNARLKRILSGMTQKKLLSFYNLKFIYQNVVERPVLKALKPKTDI